MIDSLERTENVRKLVLSKLESSQQEKYLKSLEQYKKRKPLSVRGRHTIRDIMFKVLPKSTSKKILKTYLDLKENSKE